MELPIRIERMCSFLPRKRLASQPRQRIGVSDEDRTRYFQFGRLALYLQRITHMEPVVGLEPTSFCVRSAAPIL